MDIRLAAESIAVGPGGPLPESADRLIHISMEKVAVTSSAAASGTTTYWLEPSRVIAVSETPSSAPGTPRVGEPA